MALLQEHGNQLFQLKSVLTSDEKELRPQKEKYKRKGDLIMENLMNGLYTYVTDFQPFVYILIAIALLIVGVMFIVPSEKTKEMAKGAIPWIVIGAGIVMLASQFATEMVAKCTFTA